jgi:hypothetical protein
MGSLPGTVTTRGPLGSSASNPRPKARRFSMGFSAGLSAAFSTAIFSAGIVIVLPVSSNLSYCPQLLAILTEAKDLLPDAAGLRTTAFTSSI